MSVRAKFRLADPDEVEASLTVTMRVTEWKSLLLKINESSYPGSAFGVAVCKMIREAEQAFHATGEYEG